MWFDPQNYTVAEGAVVYVTLLTNANETDFTVTLQYMDGSATGEAGYNFDYNWCLIPCSRE